MTKRLSFLWHTLFSMSSRNAAILSTALFLLVAITDYSLPGNLNLSFVYVFVILLAAWNTDIRFTLALVLLAIGMQAIVIRGANDYLPQASFYVDFVNRAFTFLLVAVFATPLKRMYAYERSIARIDPLTGVANRQAFKEALVSEMARADRKGFAFSVAYIDVDNFKAVNDEAGHQQGDHVLIEIGKAIRNTVRKPDVVARLGGDEFAVLFPHCNWDVAAYVLRRIQDQLGDYVRYRRWPVTLSIGLGTFDTPVQTPDMVMGFCDSLMYQVKRGKKDGIACQRFSEKAANDLGMQSAAIQ